MDITAQDRVYLSRAANHASGPGKVSTNHSWNIGEKAGSSFFSKYSTLEVMSPLSLRCRLYALYFEAMLA